AGQCDAHPSLLGCRVPRDVIGQEPLKGSGDTWLFLLDAGSASAKGSFPAPFLVNTCDAPLLEISDDAAHIRRGAANDFCEVGGKLTSGDRQQDLAAPKSKCLRGAEPRPQLLNLISGQSAKRQCLAHGGDPPALRGAPPSLAEEKGGRGSAPGPRGSEESRLQAVCGFSGSILTEPGSSEIGSGVAAHRPNLFEPPTAVKYRNAV